MNQLANSLKSWKTTVVGLGLVLFGVIQAAKSPSIGAAFTDPTVQIAMAGAVLGFLAKDNDVTGTAANPRSQVQGQPDPVVKP